MALIHDLIKYKIDYLDYEKSRKVVYESLKLLVNEAANEFNQNASELSIMGWAANVDVTKNIITVFVSRFGLRNLGNIEPEGGLNQSVINSFVTEFRNMLEKKLEVDSYRIDVSVNPKYLM